MRLAAFTISLIVATATVAQAGDEARQRQDFIAANEKALGGDVKGALALYEHLVADGVVNEDLYYNLGNAYAQAGRLVDAVIAYERALRLAPGDEDAIANLAAIRKRLAPQQVQDVIDAPPADPIDWLEPIVGPLPPDGFGLAAMFANLALFGLLLLRRHAPTRSARRLCTAGVVLSLIIVMTSGAVVLAQGVVARDQRAVVRTTGPLKAGPHPRFDPQETLQAGDRVRVLQDDSDWLRVKDARGVSGWLPEAAIERIGL